MATSPFKFGVLDLVNDTHAAFRRAFDDFVVEYGFAIHVQLVLIPSLTVLPLTACVSRTGAKALTLEQIVTIDRAPKLRKYS